VDASAEMDAEVGEGSDDVGDVVFREVRHVAGLGSEEGLEGVVGRVEEVVMRVDYLFGIAAFGRNGWW